MTKISRPASFARVGEAERQRLARRQPVHRKQRHVPVGMDHYHLAHGKHRARGAAVLALQVDAGGAARLERQALVTERPRRRVRRRGGWS